MQQIQRTLHKKTILGTAVGLLLVVGLAWGLVSYASSGVTVEKGQTWYELSQTHGVSVDALAEANGRTPDDILLAGETLTLPEETNDVAGASQSSVYGTTLTPDQYQVLLAVVQQEAGYDYDSALAVASVMTNRVDAGFAEDIWGVVTQPGQFEAYLAGHYQKHLGAITPETEQAVQEVLGGYKRIDTLYFWSDWYAAEQGVQGVNIGGNVYFHQ